MMDNLFDVYYNDYYNIHTFKPFISYQTVNLVTSTQHLELYLARKGAADDLSCIEYNKYCADTHETVRMCRMLPNWLGLTSMPYIFMVSYPSCALRIFKTAERPAWHSCDLHTLVFL